MLKIGHLFQGLKIKIQMRVRNNLQKFQLRAVFQHVQRFPAARGKDQNFKVRHIPQKAPVMQLQIMAEIQIFQVGQIFEFLGVFIPHIGIKVCAPETLGVCPHGKLIVGKPNPPDDFHLRVVIPDLCHRLGGNAAGIHIQAFAVFHQRKDLPDSSSFVTHDAVVEVHLLRQCAEIPSVKHKAVIQIRPGRRLLQQEKVLPCEITRRFRRALSRCGLCVQFRAFCFSPGTVRPEVDILQFRHLFQELRGFRNVLVRKPLEIQPGFISLMGGAVRKAQHGYGNRRCRRLHSGYGCGIF